MPDEAILYGDPVEWGHPLNRGLVSCYLPLRGRGAGSRLLDIAGNNHGTLINSPTWGPGRTPEFRSLEFNGSTQYVTATPAVTAVPLTLTLVCRLNTVGTDVYPLGIADTAAANDFFYIEKDNSNLFRAVTRKSSGGIVTAFALGTTAAVAGRWYTVSAVYASATSRSIYVDGKLEDTEATSATPAGLDTVGLGALVRNTVGSYWPGDIESAWIHNRALSANDVSLLNDQSIREYPDLIRRVSTTTWFLPDTSPQPSGGSLALAQPILYGHPIDEGYPLSRGLLSWWMPLRGRGTSARLFDLYGRNHLTVSGPDRNKDGFSFTNVSTDTLTSAADNTKWNPASGTPISGAVLCTADDVTPTSNAPIMSRRAATDGATWALYLNTTGVLRLIAYNSVSTLVFTLDSASGVLTAGKRHLISFRLDVGGNAQIYVDGESVASTTFGAFTPSSPATPFQVGGEASNNRAWPGTIEAAWFWRRSMGQVDFIDLYNECNSNYPKWLRRTSDEMWVGTPSVATPSTYFFPAYADWLY